MMTSQPIQTLPEPDMELKHPTIVVVGSNHEYAPVDVREQLAFAGDQLAHGLDALRTHVPEGFILSTCNRTEIYAVGESAESIEQGIFGFLSGYHHVPDAVLERASYVYTGNDAVNHLFRVASGLDSMVLGEPQILTQIREALDSARDRRAVGPMLQRLALDALHVGKRARTETDISRNRVSIAHAAVELAERKLGGIDGLNVAILGAGKMATLAAKLLRARDVGDIAIVNRSRERARELADTIGGQALPMSALDLAIAHADLVIGAAVADLPLITRADVEPRERPLLMIDLSVPRAIDQHAAEHDGVQVLDVDALDPIAEDIRRDYASEVEKVESIVSGAIDEYSEWVTSRNGAQAILAVRERAVAMQNAELDKALRRLQHLSDRDRNVVAQLASGLTNKLLHGPIRELRAIETDAERRAILRAFGVDPDGSGA